jgi:hypothetical protein
MQQIPQTVQIDIDLYLHVRVLISIILGLSVTRLIAGLVGFAQHPTRRTVSWVHLAWVAWTLFNVITFWWWEFRLSTISHWTFALYFFICFYASMYYVLSALLFPDDLAGYEGYEDYFLSRRGWFFGFVALTQALDVIDTWVKGEEHLNSLGHEYLVRSALFIALCAVAAKTRNRFFHAAFVAVALIYDASYSLRYFYTVT